MERSGRGGRSASDLLVLGGLVGPAVFVADWAMLGASRAGYSPVDDAISRLAELGVSTRPAMTGGFVIYGLGLVGYGLALRRAVPGPAWLFPCGSGVATFGVAAFPLGTPASGAVHAAFAVLGYAGLAAVPIVVAPALTGCGHRSLARLSVGWGAVSGAFLLASAVGAPAHGLTQRIGLTAGDSWVMLSTLGLLGCRRRAERSGPTDRGAAEDPAS